MKTEQISDSVKIFRLMPFFLGIAIIWSVATVIDTNAFLKMGEMPKGENNSRLIAHFIGFYLGNGIPRFIVYGFCIGFIIYNYGKSVGKKEDVNFPFVILFPLGALYTLWQNDYGYQPNFWFAYSLLIAVEIQLYRVFLTKKPVTDEKE